MFDYHFDKDCNRAIVKWIVINKLVEDVMRFISGPRSYEISEQNKRLYIKLAKNRLGVLIEELER